MIAAFNAAEAHDRRRRRPRCTVFFCSGMARIISGQVLAVNVASRLQASPETFMYHSSSVRT
jgi:hypothetical protein